MNRSIDTTQGSFCDKCGQDWDAAQRLTRAEAEAAAWKNWMREHLIGFYSQRTARGEIPSAQVTILTDIDMKHMEAVISGFLTDR
jgi:hypothetical protein